MSSGHTVHIHDSLYKVAIQTVQDIAAPPIEPFRTPHTQHIFETLMPFIEVHLGGAAMYIYIYICKCIFIYVYVYIYMCMRVYVYMCV